ncbi:multiprotein bridging factor type 1, putative [Plasmodium chabaudi chabaudi]|uniref:Multiprotein bridging factor type 1, putative n=2 Tax=Plasmodium chabaudi TaxID=5825 RepID=A0A077XES5_PLACU|nr:multiprotein-bridging factor 1, putative [Plasmodium chabaudi chabaudi]SCM21180.1 multiprotein bridging factor type 1, putative [Plasmodium chabaudi adami]SCM22265.1 multiprotein bridging factor type 1, putative [Plasmodium chabaudi chabaudi]SCN60495.1 multiprotein bridging factor type 1, putative [Plasmodium chabaudi adami]SCN60496.1 multiprotein bridging factor type 1, putative [Plasmodium chabaudi chabaudi]VTZ68850.1 multiprotein-bridging factor 1, putative [Plasmodium chabaudi chabaudi]|eukprot:XP_745950.1 multiprotein bridging factor type 1, putative [Plasmodium chabaudi chabaudi]
MQHQDLKPVIWTKNDKKTKPKNIDEARKLGMDVEVEKKFLGGKNKSCKGNLIIENKAKIEQETENFKIDRVTPAFSRALQQARMAKKLTQVQLARLVNEPESVIKEYENGKAIPNNMIIQKLNRVLGVNLPSPKKK